MRSPDPESLAAWLPGFVADCQRSGRIPSLIVGVSGGPSLQPVIAGAGEFSGPLGESQYRIGSITKTFTAALVAQQRDAGAIELDRPLTYYAPALSTGDATLRELLAHLAGLRENPEGRWWELGFSRSAEELFGGGAGLPMTVPSTYRTHHYSNLGYALAGWLLERITGKTWETLLEGSLLRPLGLTRTATTPSEPHATGYTVHPWEQTAAPVELSGTAGMAPAGQLWSSVADLLRWGRCLLGEHPEVLSAESAAEMRRPVVMCDAQWREGQGTGLQLWRSGDLVCAGHGGSVPGFAGALMTHAPSGTVAAVCANRSPLGDSGAVWLAMQVIERAMSHLAPPTQPWRVRASPPEDVRKLLGRWWAASTEYEMTYDDPTGALVMIACADPATPVSSFRHDSAEDTWRGHAGAAAGERLELERDAGGNVIALLLAGVVLRRTPYIEMGCVYRG